MKTASVILAGGAGTRLWPLSREDKPKQFHNLTGSGTLFNETLTRLRSLNPDIYLITTSIKYKNLSLNELKNAGVKGSVLTEPRPRNTASAILYSAIFLSKLYDESIMIVLPADHYIEKKDEFIKVLKMALNEAEAGRLVTLGIKPTYPETGYGYIKAHKQNGDILEVDKFVEKPDTKNAQKYLKDGNFYWNGGIFIWKTSTILECFKNLMPDLYNSFAPLMDLSSEKIKSDDTDLQMIKEQIFSSINSVSIDYGILEKADNIVVIPCDLGWTDLGSWNSIDDILISDSNNNRTPNKDRVIFVDSSNSSVFTERKRIALVGVDNLVVVESGDSILVMDKNRSEDVRRVVEIIKKSDST